MQWQSLLWLSLFSQKLSFIIGQWADSWLLLLPCDFESVFPQIWGLDNVILILLDCLSPPFPILGNLGSQLQLLLMWNVGSKQFQNIRLSCLKVWSCKLYGQIFEAMSLERFTPSACTTSNEIWFPLSATALTLHSAGTGRNWLHSLYSNGRWASPACPDKQHLSCLIPCHGFSCINVTYS